MTSPSDAGADGPAAGDDFLFLRERVDDEEIASLFTEDPAALERAVRHLIDRARDDARMEAALIDVLEMAVDEDCDETLASTWIAVILGEASSARAIEPLSRCLAREDDEALRDAARIALLRIGIPAIRFLIDEVEDGRSPEFHQGVYELLGESGIIDDAPTIERISQFLVERFAIETRIDSNERTIEALAMAAARLGVRELLEPLKDLLATRYGSAYPILEDAMCLLAENEEGRPIVPTIPPWEDRYGWLFDEETERARVRRPPMSLPEGYRYPFEGVDVTAGGKLTDSRGYLFEVPGADQALEGLEDGDEDELEDEDES